MDRPLPAYKGDEPYIFICYSHDDTEDVYREIIWLQKQGFHVWYDEGVSPGSSWHDDAALYITNSAMVLFFLSESSANSVNCQNEIDFSEKQGASALVVHLYAFEMPTGVAPAATRWTLKLSYFDPFALDIVVYLVLDPFLIALAIYDIRTLGRLHRATMTCIAALIPLQISGAWIARSDWWNSVAPWVIGSP